MRYFEISFLKSFFAPRKMRATRSRRTAANDPDLKNLWATLIQQYFPERTDLLSYTVKWSARRQKRTLGSCNITRSLVNMARELRHPEASEWIEAVLYHELCHAVLGKEVLSHCGRKAWHGAEFKELEARHPRSAELKAWITSGGWHRMVRNAKS